MKPVIVRQLAVVALSCLVGAGAASAQQGAPSGPGRHPGSDGHGGGGGAVMAIARLRNQLDLDTSQQKLWDSAAAATKSARSAMKSRRDYVRSVLEAELAKAEPDLAAVAAASDAAQSQAIAQRHEARDAWLNLYATFTPAQKAVVRTALQNRLAHAAKWRARRSQKAAPSN